MVRMLIADDSSAIQKVIRIAFAGFQIKSDEAFSIAQTASLLGKQSYELIILDVNLPGIKAEGDLKELKERARHAKFILLAGSYDEFNEDLYKKLGFQNFLRKPFDASGLINQVRGILGDRLSPLQDSSASESPSVDSKEPSPVRDRTVELVDLGRKGRKAFEGPSSSESSSGIPSELVGAAKSNPTNRTIKLSELDLGKKDFIVDPDPPRTEKEPPIFEMPKNQEFKSKIEWNELEDKIQDLGETVIRNELSKLIRQEIQKYFQDHFHTIARQVLTDEIRRLAADRQHAMDET